MSNKKIYEEGCSHDTFLKKSQKLMLSVIEKIENGITPTMGMFMAPLERGFFSRSYIFLVKNKLIHMKFLYNSCGPKGPLIWFDKLY